MSHNKNVARELQLRTKYQVYPHKNENCTLTLLLNLMEAEWMTIDCNESLVGNVLCVTPSVTDKYTNGSFVKPELKIYAKDCNDK